MEELRMQTNEPIMEQASDHIMANTWRLIFERTARLPSEAIASNPDFTVLEQLLPEYRMIGLSLAEKRAQRGRN
jgi:hypothetical protein